MSSSALVNTKEGDTRDDIPCLLVPMTKPFKLVLPTVSVAEMIPYKAPKPLKSSETMPDYFLGTLEWRGVAVPMLSYERLNGREQAELVSDSQLLILNNTGVSAHLPFLCFPTQGIPKLSRVANNEVSQSTHHVGDYDQMHVFVAGEQAIIPDVSKIEQLCVDLMKL